MNQFIAFQAGPMRAWTVTAQKVLNARPTSGFITAFSTNGPPGALYASGRLLNSIARRQRLILWVIVSGVQFQTRPDTQGARPA